MKVIWSPTARREISDVFNYLVVRNPDAAVKITETIENTVALLYDNPLMGRKSERTPSRELVIPRTNYIVIYRVMETELEILSVYHAKQNWKR